METIIKDTIKTLCDRINTDYNMDSSLKFSQSALNLAHTLTMLNNFNKDKGPE